MAVNVQRQKWVALHVLHEILQAAKTRQGALALLRTLLATQIIRSPRHRRLNPPRWQGPSAFHSMWNQIFPRHWCLLSVCCLFENVWKCLTVDPSARTGEGWADSSNERVQFFHEAWQLGPREARSAAFRVICIQVRSVRYFGKRIFKVFVAKGPSQVITSHHMLSRALTSFANVLCCCTAVQSASNFGQVQMHFRQDINFLQFPSSLGGISAAIQQTQWWDHAQRTRPLSLNFSTPVKHRWSSLTPNSRYGCQGWVSLQRTAFLHLFTSALRCKLDARFCACLNKIAAWLKSKHEGTQIQVCADTWHVGGKSCSDIHVEVRRKPAAFELQQDFVTILAYAPVFWNPII